MPWGVRKVFHSELINHTNGRCVGFVGTQNRKAVKRNCWKLYKQKGRSSGAGKLKKDQ